MVPQNPETRQAAEVIQAMAAEAGFDMKIRVVEFATSLKEAEEGRYQAYMLNWSGRPDPDGNLYIFAKSKAPQNYGGYSDPQVDAWLDEARTKSDPAERKAIYEKVAEKFLNEGSLLYLFHRMVHRPHGAARGAKAAAGRARAGGRAEAEVTGRTRSVIPDAPQGAIRDLVTRGASPRKIPARRFDSAGMTRSDMLTLIGRRLVQLLPTLFFVSVLIFSLQQLLPGDPALVMAGEEQRPGGHRADPPAVPARSADPDPVPLLDQGRAHRRPRRIHAPQGAGARAHRCRSCR